MSRNKPTVITGAIPKRGGGAMGGKCPAPGPSGKRKPLYNTTSDSTTKVQVKKSETSKKAPKVRDPYELPPLSIPMKVKELTEGQKELVEWRKKTARRISPEGEDIKKIAEILKGLKGQNITVQEFVGLVSPYTGDKGESLRIIMDAELAAFRKIAKKIYETMTQDVSDVLANEQVQLMSSFKEKHTQFADKMMRCIDEIFYHIPDFDFERYFREPHYLSTVLPIPEERIESDDEEEELLRKQEAFHRMEWLRTEGERLQMENKRLQQRLREVKALQKNELEKAASAEQDAEIRRGQLLTQQEDLKDRLDVLNQSLEKTVICGETTAMNMEKEKRKCMQNQPGKGKGKKKVSATKTRPPWNVTVAREISEESCAGGELTKLSPSGSVSSQPSLAAVKKKKAAVKKKKWDFSRPKVEQDPDPFHYSPPKSPPGECPSQPKAFSGFF